MGVNFLAVEPFSNGEVDTVLKNIIVEYVFVYAGLIRTDLRLRG